MALALSLRHGGGDPRWFYGLSREDQIRVTGLYRAEHNEALDRKHAAQERAAAQPRRGCR